MARKGTNTKSRILQMTRTLYSAHGCAGTTIDDIITATGITKGAFYHYFKSKESLCEAVLDEVISDYKKLAEQPDATTEPIDQLRQIIARLASLNASGEWVNCRLILRMSADSHESHPQMKQKIRQFWEWEAGFYEDLIARCRQAGQLGTRLDCKTQARLLIAVIAGAITLDKVLPSSDGFAELAEAVIDMLQ